ncbi:RNA-binding ATPase activator esf2 [Dispira parvispora]|uniref:18S rRNA factor 2 n=1 Tax=Dispira parvispora TaxID=1520584 RepID=A0A9W8E6A3_9FUNG|nr:RNA-binding ATPase activator esf2 [Dispira parvispora]
MPKRSTLTQAKRPRHQNTNPSNTGPSKNKAGNHQQEDILSSRKEELSDLQSDESQDEFQGESESTDMSDVENHSEDDSVHSEFSDLDTDQELHSTAEVDMRFVLPSDEEMDEQATDGDDTPTLHRSGQKEPVAKGLTPKALSKFKEELDRTGVIYLSRIPNTMSPAKVKHIFSKFGEIGRVFLMTLDAKRGKTQSTSATKGKKQKKSRKRYVEGWVEFKDKKIAKAVALTLNNTKVGGKKTTPYAEDIWNIKYLSKFKWSHLSEQIAYERAAMQLRLRNEMAQSRRENSAYVDNVAKAKQLEKIEEQRQKRMAKKRPAEDESETQTNPAVQVRRRFGQRVAKVKETLDQDSNESANVQVEPKMQSVLSKVFL